MILWDCYCRFCIPRFIQFITVILQNFRILFSLKFREHRHLIATNVMENKRISSMVTGVRVNDELGKKLGLEILKRWSWKDVPQRYKLFLVLVLRTILKEQVSKRQGAGSSTGYTYISGEETVESTSVATIRTTTNSHPHQLTLGVQHATTTGNTTMDCNYVLNYGSGHINAADTVLL
ncbi:hypothetical protein L6452_24586 [Arctium lappa]|uniref:Uncharacterized protein n=1 Tax=Arctium lappa TaxID=4217 RepID=A0ACB9A9Z6_ARCLA|nr:hypothetical protein L6452_24586 [Arctium lappa]